MDDDGTAGDCECGMSLDQYEDDLNWQALIRRQETRSGWALPQGAQPP